MRFLLPEVETDNVLPSAPEPWRVPGPEKASQKARAQEGQPAFPVLSLYPNKNDFPTFLLLNQLKEQGKQHKQSHSA